MLGVIEGVFDTPGGGLGLGVIVFEGVIEGVLETLGVFDIVGVTLGVLLGDNAGGDCPGGGAAIKT